MTAHSTNDNRGHPPDALHAMLRAGARGHLPTQAAVDLLADHGTWPQRLFRAGHVDTWTATAGDPAMAAIDWQTVTERLTDTTGRGFAASSSELSILAVAMSLAGHLDVRLGELLPRLDATNTALVATAITTACNSGVSLTAHLPPAAATVGDLPAATPPRDATTTAGPHHGRRR